MFIRLFNKLLLNKLKNNENHKRYQIKLNTFSNLNKHNNLYIYVTWNLYKLNFSKKIKTTKFSFSGPVLYSWISINTNHIFIDSTTWIQFNPIQYKYVFIKLIHIQHNNFLQFANSFIFYRFFIYFFIFCEICIQKL